MKRFVPLAFFLIAALALGATLFQRQPPPANHELINQPFPDIDLPTLNQDARATLPEGVKVINFFASWCVPCRIEHPDLLALQEEGVEMFGIAWKDSPNAARDYLEEFGDPFVKTGLDQEGRLGDQLGVEGAPETFVLDAENRIIFHWEGPLNRPSINRLRQAISETED